jgi:chemotaxis family two-component system sensor kinase Cph1
MDVKDIELDAGKKFCDTIKLNGIHEIQSYGALLILNYETLEIVQYSENASSLLQTEASLLNRAKISAFLTSLTIETDISLWLKENNKKYINCTWKTKGKPLNVWLYSHYENNIIYLEIELTGEEDSSLQPAIIMNEIANLVFNSQEQGITGATTDLCQYILRMTGFDRVCVYQFMKDDTGVVIGEALSAGMESILGYHFPATDVPHFVRAMYLRQQTRYIPDIHDNVISMSPKLDPNMDYHLDFSELMLRAPMPVHVKYVENMGAKSTLSIGIIYNNKLWGLITCQSILAKKQSIYNRLLLLLLAKLFAKDLVVFEFEQELTKHQRMTQIYIEMHAKIAGGTGILQLFDLLKQDLLKTYAADGAVLIYDDNVLTYGITPTDERLAELVNWFFQGNHSDIFVTSHLSSLYSPAKEYIKIAAGMLVFSISPGEKKYLLLFRKELLEEITWAGDPQQSLINSQTNNDYSPRSSFQAWKQTVANQSRPWELYLISAARVLQAELSDKLVLFESSNIIHK